MLFNSLHFLVFFPIVVLLYMIIPSRFKYLWLLGASYYFYMSWNPKYVILIALSTIVTWISGLLLDTQKDRRKSDFCRKMIVAASFIVNLSILGFFKYFDFFLQNLNKVLGHINVQMIDNPFDIILPVGISFYTFQALSYTVDVYRGDVKAEKNPLKYALFVSFFPQLVAGPIERSANLLGDIRDIENKKIWDFDRIKSGLIVMLYGIFLKIVVADRVSILVNQVYANYQVCDPIILMIGAVGFSIQIYCDFSSYSTIAIGAAKVMGFTLMENFETPYFARTIKDFWQRWHISLSTWFRDYLYIPLGGNRCSKIRKYFNVMVTFLVSGLWHGAGWNFIVWGGLHGAYQVVGESLMPIRKKMISVFKIKTESISYKFAQMTITFILVTIAWIFFRAESLDVATDYIRHMFVMEDFPYNFFNGGLYLLGLDRFEWKVLIVSVVMMLGVGLVRYNLKLKIDEFLEKQMVWFRWGVVFLLFFMTIIFGQYGPDYSQQSFIYFQF